MISCMSESSVEHRKYHKNRKKARIRNSFANPPRVGETMHHATSLELSEARNDDISQGNQQIKVVALQLMMCGLIDEL